MYSAVKILNPENPTLINSVKKSAILSLTYSFPVSRSSKSPPSTHNASILLISPDLS